MDSAITAILGSLLGTLAGGGIGYLLNRQAHRHQLAVLREEHKTEYSAEDTVKMFLSHKAHVERSFDALKRRLGGFGDDELRKILVRAGAIRRFRKNGSEWWQLVGRTEEYIHRARQRSGDARSPK